MDKTVFEKARQSKTTKGQGFDPNQSSEAKPIDNGGLAVADGLSNVLGNQRSEFGIVAQNLDEQMDELAEPIANYFADVVSGKALVGKVLQKMHEKAAPQSLNMQIGDIQPPALPATPTTTAADFFGKPKPIALPGK